MEEKKELIALLDYLIGHNDEHADEVEEMARKADSIGKEDAYEELLKGVEKMKEANEILKTALSMIKDE